jgi:hypothetical protein
MVCQTLEQHSDKESATEDLRIPPRGYRSFFDPLLSRWSGNERGRTSGTTGRVMRSLTDGEKNVGAGSATCHNTSTNCPGHARPALPSAPQVGPRGITREVSVIILGLILLVVGFLLKISILWTIGIFLLVVGLILMVLGTTGRAVGGRRHYF